MKGEGIKAAAVFFLRSEAPSTDNFVRPLVYMLWRKKNTSRLIEREGNRPTACLFGEGRVSYKELVLIVSQRNTLQIYIFPFPASFLGEA